MQHRGLPQDFALEDPQRNTLYEETWNSFKSIRKQAHFFEKGPGVDRIRRSAGFGKLGPDE